MHSGPDGADRLVTRREISEWAGVRRETISTWAGRHADFPKPRAVGGREYFSLTSVLAWLDSRIVPAGSLLRHESEGTTYADRVRRALPGKGVPSPEGTSDGERAPQVLTELFGPLADRVCGTAPQIDYLQLLLSFVFVRRCAVHSWSEVRDLVADAVQEQADPKRLLRALGSIIDRALRGYGVLPGAGAAFERLQTEAVEDIHHVVRLCEDLGREGFQLMLDRFEAWTRPGSGEFFTPRSVANLMAGLLLSEAEGRLWCYDPYLRGGELLAAALASHDQVSVLGESPHQDSLSLAGMNLALHGGSGNLAAGTTAPWDAPGRPRRRADRVLMNPPFNNKGTSVRRRADGEWPFGPPPASNDNYAWLQYAIASLTPDGLACVVMPNKAGVSDNEHEHAIRRQMIERGAVDCIIALPSRLFPATPVAVTLWVLAAPKGSCDRILFIDARRMGTKGPRQRFLSAEDWDAVIGCHRSWRAGRVMLSEPLNGTGTAFCVSIDEIRERDHSLDPSDYQGDGQGSRRGESAVSVPRLAAELEDLVATVGRADQKAQGLRLRERPSFEGALPGGWRRVPLSELCEIQAGPSHMRLRSAERSVDGAPDGVPIVVPKHLRDRRIVAVDPERLTPGAAAELSRFRLEEGDVLCVRTGSTGPSALVGAAQARWIFGTNLMRLRPLPSAELDPGYLLGFLSLPSTERWINDRAATATAIASISARTLGRLQVSLPPLREQLRVGSALRVLDEQIAAHRDFADAVTRTRAALATNLITGLLTAQ